MKLISVLYVVSATRVPNVYVFAGNGTSANCVTSTIITLRRLLSESLLVIPGGRDVPYLSALLGEANANIIDYVKDGGKYLGFCAGAYYASARVKFEVGDPIMEVVGERPLKFFPGTCKGAAFPGFDYASDAGARASNITLGRSHLTFPIYWNGGGAFIQAESYKGIDVLARYKDIPDNSSNVAAIHTRVNQGRALLSAVHAEYILSPDSILYSAIHPIQPKIDDLVREWLKLLELDVKSASTKNSENKSI
ncbi:biotin holocarboxylase synthetase [Entomophthora muscae]|uniref:Biotin holocarboxylase synthetase n=1 Tax=Entomophthora muscae TaxID=34485 RepID=A0ACC2TER6_9FUNG|nr:biotin holocarboxylase synthetase [Entomophthora muscae]